MATTATTTTDNDDFFTEEMTLLRISMMRIFRVSSTGNLDLSDLEDPDIENGILDEMGRTEMGDMWAELEEAANGDDAVTAEIAKWREELAAEVSA